MNFPIFKTKMGDDKKFNLADPVERAKYFKLKCGTEIEKLKEYLEENTFIAYLLGKKNSGKGTYSKMFAEAVGPDKVEHVSIGDMIRSVDLEVQDPVKRKELMEFLEKNYRGFISLEDIMKSLESRDTKKLLPDELILALAKREISKRKGKVILLDGFPRNLDQVGFSLFFRDLVEYRDDPDIFILIDLPSSVINERIKGRRICPKCNNSRNINLFPTSKIGYDKSANEFYLICDAPNCSEERMITKEGDEKGIELIKERLATDQEILERASALYGIPKVFMRNTIPVDIAKDYVDDYEITPAYSYAYEDGKVKVVESPWIINDDEGIPCVSLQAAPVTVTMIKQLVDILKL